MNKVVKAYRMAAQALWGANPVEAAHYIVDPADDTGEWAPNSLAVIYLEPHGGFPEDEFTIPYALDYYSGGGFDACIELADKAGVGYIEYINAAVAAVYP